MGCKIGGFFDREHINWPRRVPELWGTRVGYLDLIPGPLLRYWIVFDHDHNPDGSPGRCDLKGFIILPTQTALIGRAHVGARLTDLGLTVPELVGRHRLSSGNTLLM